MEKTLKNINDIRICTKNSSLQQKMVLVGEVSTLLQEIQKEGGDIEYISYWIFDLLGISDIYPSSATQKHIEQICADVIQKAQSIV